MCGGTFLAHYDGIMDVGLSPRVRGNPESFRLPHSRYRSIPACAGEPLTLRNRVVRQEVYPRVCGGTF